MHRSTRRRIAGGILAASLLLAACSEGGDDVSASTSPTTNATSTQAGAEPISTDDDAERVIPANDDPEERKDDQWQDVAGRHGPDSTPPSANAEQCIADATLPLAEIGVTTDPMADLATGRTASVFGSIEPLDDVVTFDDLAHYPDPSTPHDLDALIETWQAAGFSGGVAAKRQEGNNLVMVTVVRFASPADARTAVSAHLRDLCHKAVRFERLPDGDGMWMLRESGAVRSVGVLDRYEISLFVCVCVGADGDERIAAVEDWRGFLDRRWSESTSDEYQGNDRA